MPDRRTIKGEGKFEVQIEGLEDALARFADVPKKLKKKYLKKAMSDIGKKTLWAARALTPRKTSTLYKSLGRKVKVYRDSGVMVSIVGVRKGYDKIVGHYIHGSRPGSKRKYGPGDPRWARPTKYLHLVERGTRRTRAVHMLRDAGNEVRPYAISRLRECYIAAVVDASGISGRAVA